MKKIFLISTSSLFVAAHFFTACRSVNSVTGPPIVNDPPTSKISSIIISLDGMDVISANDLQVLGNLYLKKNTDKRFHVDFFDQQGESVILNVVDYKICCNLNGSDRVQMQQCTDMEDFDFYLCGVDLGKTRFQLILLKNELMTYTSPKIDVHVGLADRTPFGFERLF